ncbi:MAG TPA: flagellar basal body rod protein, partial [Desulfovibrio sp.]|nr:flagellar basal body rod protein [Desulfovibrio sp.]
RSKQNGYAEGFLASLDISSDGTVIGRYSNGQNDELYRITLYRFTSEDGLRREGMNHFSATKDSG